MRVHIQTPPAGNPFEITPAQWTQACARAGEADHQVSFATDRAGFEANMAQAELLAAAPGDIVKFLPVTAPALRLVFAVAAGVEKLAPFDWLPKGVPLVNNSGAHGPKMVEYALVAFLMLVQRFPAALAAQRAREWHPGGLFTPVAKGKRVTIVGTGGMGSAAARAARILGMPTIGVRTRAEPHPDFDRIVTADALDAVLPDSDFLLLACPLTPATRNLMSRERFGRLKRGAGIINVSRGEVVDQDALCDWLERDHLAGAVLDVAVPEPLPADNRLWAAKNLIITPHISADDPVTYIPASLDILFANLKAWRAGAPMPNLVDTARGY